LKKKILGLGEKRMSETSELGEVGKIFFRRKNF